MLHAQTSALVIEELLLTLQAVVLTTFFVAPAGSSRGGPASARNGSYAAFWVYRSVVDTWRACPA